MRIEPYVTPSGELKRAFSYGDSNLNITIWYKVEEFQDVAIWEIPEQSPWANTKVWSRDSLANPNSNSNAVRSRPPADYTISNNYRGSAPRGRNTRGRPPIQRGSGRVGRNYNNYQGYREDTNSYNYDWQGSPERQSSGAGRSSRGARRDSTERHKERPGHRDSRDGIRESRANSQERSSHREAREEGARGSRANSPERSGHREARGSRVNSPDRLNQRESREPRRNRGDSRERREDQRSRRGNYDSRQEGNYTDDSSGRENRRGDGRRNYDSGRPNSTSYRNT